MCCAPPPDAAGVQTYPRAFFDRFYPQTALELLERVPGFSLDTGAQATAGQAFGREATVGLEGKFGTVKLGKQFNAFDDVSGAAATVFDSDLAPINNVFASGAFASTDANTVKYISPSFSGFSGSVSYGFGEDAMVRAVKVEALNSCSA